MATHDDLPLTASLIDEDSRLTLQELSSICAVDERHLIQYVEEGVLNVVEVNSVSWHFSGGALRRARMALRLERDLELNMAGVALALDLIEEIEQLRRAVKTRR